MVIFAICCLMNFKWCLNKNSIQEMLFNLKLIGIDCFCSCGIFNTTKTFTIHSNFFILQAFYSYYFYTIN